MKICDWKFLHFFSITIPASTRLVFWSYLRYRNTDIKKVMIFTWKENVDHNIIFYKLTKAEVYSRHPDTTTLWLAMEDYPGSRWTPLVHATLVKIVIIIICHLCNGWALLQGVGDRGLGGVLVYPYYTRIPKTDCLYPPLCHLLFFNALSSLPCIRNEVQCKHGSCPMIFVFNGSGNWYLPNGICWLFENNLLFWRICVKLSDFRCSAHINQYHTIFIPCGVIQSFLRW